MLKAMNLCWTPWIYVENRRFVVCAEMESTLYATGERRAIAAVCREEILWPYDFMLKLYGFYVETHEFMLTLYGFYVETHVFMLKPHYFMLKLSRTDAYESEK